MKNLYNKNSKYAFSFFFGFIAIISISNEIVAQVRVPFTQRTSAYSPNKKIYNVKGDFTMVGNTNLTLQNYGNSIGNENSMVYVDSDTDSNTWNSSSSTLGFSTENGAIPNCSNIIYAGLYWTGRTSDSNPSSTTFSVTKNMPIVSTINDDLNVGNGIAIANTSYVLTISRGGSANNRYPIYTFTSGSNTYVFNYTNAAPITLSVNGGTATNIPVSIVTNGLTETATFTTPYIITDGLIGLTINSLVRSTDTNLNPANTQNTSFANVNVSGTVPTTTTVTKNFDKRKILLKGPRATSYTQFTANDSDIYYPTTTDGFMYSAYKEVTDYVRTNGIGEYFTADMALVEGNGGGTGFYGGWGLIVVYENSKMKYRDVTIFDGHAYVAAGITNYELPVSGFNSGQAGPIGMKIGVISGEGDVGITGDYFQIQKQSDATFLSLNHSGNTTTNFFNSSIQTGGNARNPSLLNNTGLDISMFSIPNVNNTVITNNQTSTKFKYGTTGDTYIIFAIAMAIDAYIPEPEIISSVTSINGISVSGTGPFTVLPGQEVEYKLKVYNKGTEPLNSTKITIPISNTASIVAGSAINTIYFNPFPTPNNVYFDPLISANGSLIWNIGTLPLPVSPTILLGELTFKVKVTENCTILKNTNCLPNLTLYGSLSGIGAITNIALNEKPFIQGYTDSGICQGEPIKSPLTINIDSRNFINQNCSAAPSEINFSFCSGENAIPISQINSGFAPGTRFYNSYPINANSIEYTSSNPFPNNATTTTYYAIPPGLADCYFTFKISAFTTPVFTILNNYIINACNNTANISRLSYSETPISITLAEFIENGGTTSNELLNYSISYVDLKSGNCPINIIRTFTVSSACGVQNLIQHISIIDTTLPTASNPNSITILGCNGTFPSPNISLVADALDNCSTPNVTFVNDSLPTISGCTETTIRTYKVTDACGNFITVSQNLIRTIDTTLPTASNPTNISILGCNGTFPSPAVSVVTDASDNCSTPLVSFVNDSLPTISGCTETTIRTYKVTDVCGNFINVTQNLIRTIDTTLPTASNPANIAISGCNGTFSAPNISVVADASDNCSTPNVSFVNDSLPTVSGCTETTVRTYKVTDACGNFITVSQNLIRTIDTTLPTASNPTNISISGCNGTFSGPNISVVTDALDNCSTPNITFVNDSLPTISGCTETTIRTYKVTDSCGNFITVSQNLIRTIDTTFPTASNPANISILGCNGTFPSPAVSVVTDALDNCSTPNVSFVNDSAPTVSGCTETTIRTYKVTDACGNFITVSQNLIRTIDTTLPTASNPNSIAISGCNGTFPSPAASVVADASDNCSTPNVTFVNDSLPTLSGCTETTIRTYKVTDACGNFITVTQNLIRTIDTTLPTASNPTNISLLGCNGTFPSPTVSVVTDASDNCSTPLVSFVNDSLPTVSGCNETTVRTYKVTDACGNFITVSQNLIRTIDSVLPTASNPTDITISGCNGTFENPNSAVVTDASDNCSTPIVSFVNDSVPNISGCTETTIRTYKVKDACENFITVTQNLIRTIDTTLPTASNPANISILGCNGTFPSPAVSVVADASDNCSTPNVSFVNDSAPTVSGCTETTIRTYKVADACGNFINVTQNLIRTIDTTLPTASNPANISILGCNGTFPSPAVSAVTNALDNCSTPLVSFVNDSLPTISGCTETTVRTYKVTDACGNFITVTQNLIRTIDTTLPTASNPANISILGCNGTFPSPAVSVVADASDNCSTPIISFVNDSLPIVSGCTETTVRTYKVTDTCGNFINVTQNLIRTIDTTLPTASNPANISILGCNGTFPNPAVSVVADASDNCSAPNVTFVNDSLPTISGCTETTIRTYKVTDACGNFITVTQNLIRTIDTILPTASNPANISILGCNGTFPSPAVSVVTNALDNCSTPLVSFVNDSAPTVSGCTETTIRTYKVTDVCGNFINVTQNLIRTIDTTLPTASNPNPIAISGCNGTFPNPAVSVVTDALDNCSTPNVSFVNDSAPTVSGCTETTIRTYKVTDACGNFINVRQNLIRTIDTALPTASNPENISILGCNGTFPIPTISVVADASDNCSTPNVTFVNDSLPTISGCTETTIRTYKVADACGNFINVTQNLIRTIDSTLPTASNPANISILGCNGTFPSPAVSVVADASDNCSTPLVSFVNDSLPTVSGCTETTVRTYKVTDACGNFITVSQNLIRTIDSMLPNASNPNSIAISGCNGTFDNPNSAVVTDASDNCSTTNVSFVNDSLPIISGCTETTVRTYKVTDACGNFITVSQNLIRTIDTTLPTASNPANISISGCNGTFSEPNISVVTDASDNCSTPNVTFVNDSLPTISGCTETTIRTYKVTDACGNFINVTQNLIRTIDTTLPTASNPANISILGCNGTFPSPAVSVVADASDNCSTPNVTFVNDSLPTVSGCIETTIRTYKVTDACGNFITVTQNLIRTIDTTLPTASNPNPIEILGCNGTFPNADISVVADAFDNCSIPNVTFVNDSLPTVSGCIETTIRTYKVTDACGNFINVTQNLIRTIDTTLPTASNPNPIAISGCNGTFSEPNILVVTDASDNCSTPLVSFVNDSLPTISGCTETTVRTYKVTDACGNFITISQNLIRTIDTTLPTASNPNPIEISGCNGTFSEPNSAVVTDASDNCSTTNVSFVNDSLPIISGCTETTVRTYKVTDACGNFITVSQNLIRTIDMTLPTASNPNPIEISGCNGTFSAPNIAVVTDASDNCSTPLVSFVNDSLPTISGCTETNVRTYKVTDACGNFIIVSQNLIRTIDTTLPTASNPNPIEILGCNGTFSEPNISVVTDALDNCSTPIVSFVNDSLPTVSGCTETTVRTYKVTDACGNFINVTQNLIRTIDTTLPTASNPNPIEISGCNGTFSAPNIAVVTDALDNCSTPLVSFVNDSLPTVSGCTETTVRTYKVTDACGNFIIVSQNLIRTIDTTLPTASNPANISILGCNGTFPSPAVSVVADASDNCSTPIISFVNDSLPIVSGCTETTIRTYKVTDACGNFITVMQNLIRTIDTTLPTASNPTNISLLGCNGTFPSPTVSVVTDASDNCSTPLVSFVNDSLPTISGCTETTVRTYKVTDACGNFITVMQNLIRTIDTTLPTASNPENISILGCNGTFPSHAVSAVTNASDNCSTPLVSFVNDSLPIVSGCTETTIRTYKVTDACGNFINVRQNLIRTIDTILPTASNPANISILGCNGTFPSPAVSAVTNALDNCSTPLVSFVNDSLPTISGCTETTVRTYKVTDACGNFINVTQNLIRIIDTTLPTASNPANISILGCNGTFPSPAVSAVTNALDNCSTPLVSFVNDSLPTISGCTETTVRTYKVADACGNFINVTQNLIRTIDSTLPTASNPANISISGCNGTFPSPAVSVVADASDNCSAPLVSFVNDSLPTVSGCTETTIRTYKVTDACGNFITVTQNLIRTIDTTAPTFTSPIPINISVSCNAIPVLPIITAVDNCGTTNITLIETRLNGSCNSSYVLKRTWTANDSCGNSKSVSQEISVSDTEAPTIAGSFDAVLNVNCDRIPATPILQFVDNCSGVGTIILPSADVQINQTSSSYSIIRAWNVSDLCGNSHIFTQTINVTIQDSFTVLQEQACNGDASAINLNDLIPINSVGLGTWTDSNTGMAITNGSFTPLGVLLGEHSFEYKISDLFCPRKIQILMNVNDDCLVLACGNIVVHNAFSPNNDGLNEIFTIENLENKTCYPTNKVAIYNRWGVLIYETEGYNNNDIAFKGISEGRTTIKKSDELPSGTYYYILNFTDDQGKKHNKDGYLYLSR